MDGEISENGIGNSRNHMGMQGDSQMEMDDDMGGNNSQYMYNQNSPRMGDDMDDIG